MLAEAFAWVLKHPVVSHCLIALVLMAVIASALRLSAVRGFAWHAAAYTSLYFYARETAQAERALKPAMGDPGAFLWTLWPGNWSAGGNLWEWLVPTLLTLALAALLGRGSPAARRP